MALNGIWPLSLPLSLSLSISLLLQMASRRVRILVMAVSDREMSDREIHAARSDSSTTTASDGGGEIGIGP